MAREIKHNLDQTDGLTQPQRVDYRLCKLVAAFRYAFHGIWYLLSTQRNAQIHCLVGACAVALAAVLRVERWEWAALLLTITLVLAAEGVNTAVEAAVDLVTIARHPLAKVAKDVAAGTVLLCAIASVIVGCVIFLPRLIPLLAALAG
ncbi:MAG: diacylglycerol kinase family protein [Chloroflexales bacterium]|nr:diacylglycerol kinase family protein [Chloroflexales bacterium]